MARATARSAEAELLARGNLTLPKALRDVHDLKPGTRFTLIDLGGGSLMSSSTSATSLPPSCQ
jgi:bifunctional DNA-binding transcriptional regulator/antitoxin component of YhaV-PrlF toxin-antitoxin module